MHCHSIATRSVTRTCLTKPSDTRVRAAFPQRMTDDETNARQISVEAKSPRIYLDRARCFDGGKLTVSSELPWQT
eukprot:scaffold236038_cov19-Prasinocladus_malaysianus.AAC.1